MLKLAFIWANELRVGLFSKTRGDAARAPIARIAGRWKTTFVT
jgi:hypothetical protein